MDNEGNSMSSETEHTEHVHGEWPDPTDGMTIAEMREEFEDRDLPVPEYERRADLAWALAALLEEEQVRQHDLGGDLAPSHTGATERPVGEVLDSDTAEALRVALVAAGYANARSPGVSERVIVRALQHRLRALGYTEHGTSGRMDKDTVIDLQRLALANDVRVSLNGEFDAATSAALHSLVESGTF